MAPPCSVFLELVSSSLQLVFTHCALGSRGSRATSPGHLPPKQERAGLCECFPTQTPTSLYLGTPGWGPSQAGLAQMPHCLPAPGGPFGHISHMGKLRLGQAGPPGQRSGSSGAGLNPSVFISQSEPLPSLLCQPGLLLCPCRRPPGARGRPQTCWLTWPTAPTTSLPMFLSTELLPHGAISLHPGQTK